MEPLTKHDRIPRVLVVDDNSINLNLILAFMKQQLAILDSAENGELAVNAVERMRQGYDANFMNKIPFLVMAVVLQLVNRYIYAGYGQL